MGKQISLLIKTFFTTASLIRKDKLVIFYCLLPVTIGMVSFYFLFDWMFNDLRIWGMNYISGVVNVKAVVVGIISSIVYAIMGVLFYFIVNISFVLVVSLLSCPFNDLISGRIEKQLQGGEVSSLKILTVITNEIKKLGTIGGISLLAFLLGLSSILLPISLILWAYLMSVGFLDYTWCRHNLKLSECLRNIRGNYIAYGLSGAAFMTGFAVPILNIFLLPYAVAYYTVLYIEGNRA